jgi:TPR repeat protein
VQSEAELRAAEVRCDQRLAAECLRAAAAYAEGKVVKGDPQRVTRNQKIARTLYVRQCSASDAVACFQLARLYSEGELVPADPKNAKVLRDRAAEICATKQTALCDEIRRHAAK